MRCRLLLRFVPLLFGIVAVSAGAAQTDEPPRKIQLTDGPLTPQQALEAFQLEPGLKIELVAAEPTVESPVAMAFDEQGRLYVAENRGYPTGPPAGEPPAGRIARLEDADGDGYFEKRTDFATELTFPNGMLPWKGGLIVTCAPDVLYLKDTDGDGKADHRKVLFTGFSTAGSTQLRVSHPTLGPDNWVYLTSGLMGGNVTCPDYPDRPAVELKRTDFRFRPDTDQYEAADGGAQFGQTFDDFGNRFICYNRVQVQHVVISSRVLRRNPHLAFSETVQNCPEELAPEPLKGHGAAARLYPISSNVTTADSHAGTFTAACAVTVYRGTGLPTSYRGGAFSCDPTGNLIHFDRLERNGATFSARRAREEIEFVASPDNWFRPVFLAHCPEGALYVCDMYRKTIEHPDYLPVEIRKHTDFEGGKGMGRIYRIVRSDMAAGHLQARRKIDLGKDSTADLCQMLADDDGWRRSTAERLLLERRDPESIPLLERAVGTGEFATTSALRLLDTFGMLRNEVLRRGFQFSRQTALEIVESRLAANPGLLNEVISAKLSDNPRDRFLCAIACGASSDPIAVRGLADIAWQDASDRWTRAAVFSSIGGRESVFLETLLERGLQLAKHFPNHLERIPLFSELGRLMGASEPAENRGAVVRKMVKDTRAPMELRGSFLTGFADALRNRGVGRGQDSVLLAVFGAGTDPHFVSDRGDLRDLFREQMDFVAKDSALPVARRQAAVALLAHAEFSAVGKSLLAFVDTRQPTEIQSAAVRALGGMSDPSIASTLLEETRFSAYTPALREEVLSALLAEPQHLPSVLTALETGAVPAAAIDPIRRKRLTENADPSIRERAAKAFASFQTGDREKVYEDYKMVLALSPDSENGRAVFKKTCAVCHRLDREGTPVGPDLFGIRNQPKEAILMHILIPEAEITPGFAAYILETKSGRVVTGIIASETATGVTLRQQLGKEETVLRTDIESLVFSKLSLMPQQIEKSMTKQELADLIAYLKGEKKLP
jgi:putative membrane-bound dehydrogenase-like protein